MTTNSSDTNFEDLLLVELLKELDEGNASRSLTDRHPAGSRRFTRRRVAFTAAVSVVCGAAAVGLTVLSPASGPGIASAAVVARAAAALDPANVVMYQRVSVYGWNLCLGEELPTRCFESPEPPAGGLSRDPSSDKLSYSYQEWAFGGANHVIYNTGDETAKDAQTSQSYDPVDNTLTTVTLPTSGGHEPGTLLLDTGALTPTDIKKLYAEAQRGSVQVRLGTQSTLNGEHVYELEFAGQPLTEQLFVDGQTFLPVEVIVNKQDAAGILVSQVETIAAEALPATEANQSLLTIGSHGDATRRVLTQSELEAQRGTVPVSIANAAGASASRSTG